MKKNTIFFLSSILVIFLSCSSKHIKKSKPNGFVSDRILDPASIQYAWMDEQIETEFTPFRNGITLSQIEEICRTSQPIQRFKIISNQVHGPDGKMKNLLETLCQSYTLPDVDFVYFLHDGFIIEPKNGSIQPPIMKGPIFTSAKHHSIDHAIFFADWYFDPRSRASKTFDWALISINVNKYSTRISWEKKQPIAVWRGGFQGYMHDYSPNGFENTPRGKACLLSLQNPDIIDAGTNWPDTNATIQNLLAIGIDPRKTFLTHKKQIKYKYVIDIDGHTCTYPGLQWKMLSNSTVIKQETPNKMWYFCTMTPWVHYVPVKEDMSDLKEKVLWCIANDKEAKAIADKGRELALNAMMPEHCLLYCYKVLIKYAQLQNFTPTL